MDFKKKTGVNYDYILALKKEGDRVRVIKYPIIRHSSEIDRALEHLIDENSDACDVYNAFRRCLLGHEYDYCLNYEYTDRYIKPIKVEFDHYQYERELRKRIDSRVEAKVRWLSNYEKNDRDKLAEIRKAVWDQMYRQIRTQKEALIDMALPYVYAQDYEDALRINNIVKGSIIYSHERHGDSRHKKIKENTIEHQVNKDISIKISTNFCYGYSSYFHIIVVYKGIALLPYSAWVKYYYARIAELLGYTRSYELNRESWHTCMNFLENFINSAISNPEEFIRKEVLHEVKGLIDGLEKIFKYDEKQFKDEILVNKLSGEQRYIGIRGLRNAIERDEEEYNIAPKEISMIYKMEKISGALKFLDSLKSINAIYSEVSKVIHRIIEMNQIILPDVESAILIVEDEINKLSAKLLPLKKRLSMLEGAYKNLNERLEKFLDSALSKNRRLTGEETEIIRKDFEENNPRYVELKESVNNLKSQVNGLVDKIYKRNRALKNLNSYKDLILKYAV